jgi:hypothetical protein
MLVLATDTGALIQTVWVSLVAGVGISFVFSFVIVGAAKAGDARRAGRGGAALLFGGLAVLAFALFAAGVVLGVHAMISG